MVFGLFFGLGLVGWGGFGGFFETILFLVYSPIQNILRWSFRTPFSGELGSVTIMIELSGLKSLLRLNFFLRFCDCKAQFSHLNMGIYYL